jgi:hypothetical protein
MFATTKTLFRADRLVKLSNRGSNRGRRALVREVRELQRDP